MDDRILELLSAGDQEGITLLQKQYGNMVRYIVRGILPDAQDAEECISDIYLRVWEKFASFDRNKGSLAAWLTAVARNAAVDRRRRSRAPEQKWEGNQGASPSPADGVLRRESTRHVRAGAAKTGLAWLI